MTEQAVVPEVLVTAEGITIYPPLTASTPWRACWIDPDGKRRWCRAVSEPALAIKLEPVKARLIFDAHRTKAKFSELIAHYLDPGRLPADKPWAPNYRADVRRYCGYILATIGDVPCEKIKVRHFQDAVNAATTAATGKRRAVTVKALVSVGLADGFLTNPRLGAVHWQANGREVAPPKPKRAGEASDYIDPKSLPSHAEVSRLASATQQKKSAKWWHELLPHVAAYSGMRHGEIRALVASRIDVQRRTIDVLEQYIYLKDEREYRLLLPKGGKTRVTIYPARTPSGYPLAENLARRVQEALEEQARGVNPHAVLFPNKHYDYMKSHTLDGTILEPAYAVAGWRAVAGGRGWTFHTLRHVFCSTAIHEWGVIPADVTVLAGHANNRITMEIYVGTTSGTLDRAFEITRDQDE